MDILQLPKRCEAADGGGRAVRFPTRLYSYCISLTRHRTNRNWRWHKKMQIWLTKDDMMVPQALSPNHERGYYIIWDTVNWRKERVCGRELLDESFEERYN